MALAKAFEPFLKWASKRYTVAVGEKLKDYGLRYDDLQDPLLDMDVAEAIRRLPPQVVLERNARLKRALDLSMKHEVLPKELREKQTPFESYLVDMVEQVKAEKRERATLGTRAPYQRTIP